MMRWVGGGWRKGGGERGEKVPLKSTIFRIYSSLKHPHTVEKLSKKINDCPWLYGPIQPKKEEKEANSAPMALKTVA